MQISAFAVSNLLTNLLDRPVQTVQATDAEFSPNTHFATYLHEPDQSLVLVKIDLRTLASLSGLLIGMPAAQTEQAATRGALDDDLTDAAREVMNILASVVVGEGRAIFKQLYRTEAELPLEAKKLLRMSSLSRLSLKCAVAGKPTGMLSICFSY